MKFETLEALCNAVDEWFFNDVLKKKLKYKESLEDDDKIKEHLASKHIHICSETDVKRTFHKYVVKKNNVPIMSCYCHYETLTMEVDNCIK